MSVQLGAFREGKEQGRVEERKAIVARLRELASRGRDPRAWQSWDDASRFLFGCATVIEEEGRLATVPEKRAEK